MAKVEWDKTGDKRFFAGIDRGVLYPQVGPGVPWNGLRSVEVGSDGGTSNPFYIDGVKYHNESTPEDLTGVISAFTYPDEFAPSDGHYTNGRGLYYGQQKKPTFGLSYRSKIGNDVNGIEHGYQIHIIYNILAESSTRVSESLGPNSSAEDMSWSFTTKAIRVAALKNVSEIIIDTRTSEASKVRQLENILYGLELTNPRLPTPSEVITLFDDWGNLQIYPNYTTGLSLLKYRGRPDLTGDVFTGLFKSPENTRLKETAKLGLYRLEV